MRDIQINEDLRCFFTAGSDGRVFMYNSVNFKLLRGFYAPQFEPIDKLLVTTIPLYGVIIFSKNNIYSYSLNG